MKFAYLNEPPFNHKALDGTVTGTDVELAKVINNELNLGDFEPVEAEFSDGLLVSAGNPKQLNGYRSIAKHTNCTLAVIRDQFQHRSAVEFGVTPSNLRIFETYTAAANAVLEGDIDAYASVGRAHTGYIELNDEKRLEVVTVPPREKQPAFGSFAFNKKDIELRKEVNRVLRSYYGSDSHRKMMHSFGFDDTEIDLVVGSYQ